MTQCCQTPAARHHAAGAVRIDHSRSVGSVPPQIPSRSSATRGVAEARLPGAAHTEHASTAIRVAKLSSSFLSGNHASGSLSR